MSGTHQRDGLCVMVRSVMPATFASS